MLDVIKTIQEQIALRQAEIDNLQKAVALLGGSVVAAPVAAQVAAPAAEPAKRGPKPGAKAAGRPAGKTAKAPAAAKAADAPKGKAGRPKKVVEAAAPAPVAQAAPAPAAPVKEAALKAAKAEKAPKAAKPSAEAKKAGRKPQEIRLVADYQDAASWNEKVIWAISKGAKTADEITKAVHAFEGGDAGKLKTLVSNIASTLAKKGGLVAVRVGRGFEYSLQS